MTRAAQVGVVRVVVLIAAMLVLAGCANTTTEHAVRPHVANLCVDVGLPLSGGGSAAGRGVLTGLKMQIPASGVRIGDDHVRLCQIHNTAPGPGATALEGVVTAAVSAAADKRTIAYVGELSGADAGDADAVLGPAGIPLVTPSGPAPAAKPTSAATPGAAGGGGGTAAAARSALYLLPSSATQATALAYVRASRSCSQLQRGRPATCTIVSAPLCAGIAGESPAEIHVAAERLCVVAGSDLAKWASPAVAYGDSAGQLLLAALHAVNNSGRDIADRAAVYSSLLGVDLRSTLIGPIRFDPQGAIESDAFSVYTVGPRGGLVLSQTFRTH